MARILSILVGLFVSLALVWSFGVGFVTWVSEETTQSAEYVFHEHPKDVRFASDGAFGTFDRQQLQRGYQVYKETCAACHSLRLVAFRDLEQLGYSEPEVRAEALTWSVPGIDPDTGEQVLRPATPTDYFPEPFQNEVAARAANNNAVPPDLSLITKARHDGPAYVYSLLTGYQNPPAALLEEFPEAAPGTGLYYNPYFHSLNLAMAPPLIAAGQVTYADGTDASIAQMSKDVSAFLIWTAEPTLEKRKQTGWPVLGFLLFATILGYMSYRNIWASKKPKKVTAS